MGQSQCGSRARRSGGLLSYLGDGCPEGADDHDVVRGLIGTAGDPLETFAGMLLEAGNALRGGELAPSSESSQCSPGLGLRKAPGLKLRTSGARWFRRTFCRKAAAPLCSIAQCDESRWGMEASPGENVVHGTIEGAKRSAVGWVLDRHREIGQARRFPSRSPPIIPLQLLRSRRSARGVRLKH